VLAAKHVENLAGGRYLTAGAEQKGAARICHFGGVGRAQPPASAGAGGQRAGARGRNSPDLVGSLA
jgi:hypothetical protein